MYAMVSDGTEFKLTHECHHYICYTHCLENLEHLSDCSIVAVHEKQFHSNLLVQYVFSHFKSHVLHNVLSLKLDGHVNKLIQRPQERSM